MFKLSAASKYELLPSGPLFRALIYADQDERNLVRQLFRQASNKQVHIHILKKANIPYGFVALSIKEYNEVPSLRIDYLFVSSQYRRQGPLSDLGESPPLRISEFLLGRAIQIAINISSKVPLRYIHLQAVDDWLQKFYERNGFSLDNKEGWMSMDTPPGKKSVEIISSITAEVD